MDFVPYHCCVTAATAALVPIAAELAVRVAPTTSPIKSLLVVVRRAKGEAAARVEVGVALAAFPLNDQPELPAEHLVR